jgi:hypothetical protein
LLFEALIAKPWLVGILFLKICNYFIHRRMKKEIGENVGISFQPFDLKIFF